MNIKTELLKAYISDYINYHIEDFEIDANSVSDTVVIKMLAEIQDIILNNICSDFEIVERIGCVFEKYKIDFGNCLDF